MTFAIATSLSPSAFSEDRQAVFRCLLPALYHRKCNLSNIKLHFGNSSNLSDSLSLRFRHFPHNVGICPYSSDFPGIFRRKIIDSTEKNMYNSRK